MRLDLRLYIYFFFRERKKSIASQLTPCVLFKNFLVVIKKKLVEDVERLEETLWCLFVIGECGVTLLIDEKDYIEFCLKIHVESDNRIEKKKVIFQIFLNNILLSFFLKMSTKKNLPPISIDRLKRDFIAWQNNQKNQKNEKL